MLLHSPQTTNFSLPFEFSFCDLPTEGSSIPSEVHSQVLDSASKTNHVNVAVESSNSNLLECINFEASSSAVSQDKLTEYKHFPGKINYK